MHSKTLQIRWQQLKQNQTQPSTRHPNWHRFGKRLGCILVGFGEPGWSQTGTRSLLVGEQSICVYNMCIYIYIHIYMYIYICTQRYIGTYKFRRRRGWVDGGCLLLTTHYLLLASCYLLLTTSYFLVTTFSANASSWYIKYETWYMIYGIWYSIDHIVYHISYIKHDLWS